VSCQLGPNGARMQGIDRDIRSAQLFGQVPREEDVRQFALTIGGDFVVRLCAHQVLLVDAALQMGQTGYDYNAAGCGGLDQIQQEIRQQKVSQMIHTDLSLKSIFGQRVGTHHHAGVVDEDVEFGFLFVEPMKKSLISVQLRN
jgi:hypothetical protein